MSPTTNPPLPLLATVRGHVGEIVLNRERSINAITGEMVALLHTALDDWADDPEVQSVVIRGAGARGLCSGADIRHLAQASAFDRHDFFSAEYELDLAIAEYAKPVVTFMDGITMGAGVGVSAHAAFPVVTEQSRVAMPEVRIGLVPDVGANWILSRAPGRLGFLLAYTASDFTGADAIALGFAKHFVPSDFLEQIVEELSAGVGEGEAARERTAEIISHAEVAAPSSPLLAQQPLIDELFADPEPLTVIERLRAHGGSDTAAIADQIESMCPFSVAVARHSLELAATQTLAEVFATDLRVCSALTARPDFREGVRAQVIDKDRNPVWNPAHLTQVTPESAAAFPA
ncbi:enoyl-CoA hydratase/isomerase family protein [Pseudoclavibacter soli]|uniref:enoyl-CoA hydratase/isomerase family protein n=1 Tax=Pseudoclavibacter soli TaxID=452623 RepID=UPI00040EC6CE|nr:enoyl-CoA hydratase/isomerase family protein [Pseudoclavibacter soli]